jgi:lipopolysaccharide transport system ATP-binding protein
MIEVRDLHKRFRLYRRPQDRLLESLLRRPRHRTHHVLRGLDFEVAPGETLGVLGCNGAGKSTLLKLLMGVLLPDAGEIRIDGKITGLLELGTGFDSTMTGLGNIERNGVLLGMSHAEIAARRDAIIAFSELGRSIGEPLRTYSSGMIMRLAFSIAIHADPRCFLVDEALSVGDAHFQQKCMRRIQEFRAQGGSLIFVSHDLNAVKVLCDRAVVLEEGRIAAGGTPEDAVNYYNRLIASMDEGDDFLVPQSGERHCYGSGEVEIQTGTLNGVDSDAAILSAGESTQLEFTIRARANVEDFTLGFLIRDRFGRDIFGTNTHFMHQPLRIAKGEVMRLRFGFPMNLAPGSYTLTAALHSGQHHLDACYHWCDNLIGFEVAGIRGHFFYGLARLEPALLILGSEST